MAAGLIVQLLLAALSSISYATELDMKFLKYPESVTAPVGDKVAFECEVNVPAEWIVWRWRPADEHGHKWTDVLKSSDVEIHDTATYSRLAFHITEQTLVSQYQCVVSFSSIVLMSVPAKLSISRIELSNNSPETRVVVVPIHNTVVLHCKEPLSDPPAVLTWWKDVNGVKKQLETPYGVLVIQNATYDDSGTYGCKAFNELSGEQVDLPEKTYLRVQKDGGDNKYDRFIESEEYVGSKDKDDTLTVSVKLNGVLRVWCGAVGVPPPTVTWHREGRGSIRSTEDNMLVVSPFTLYDEGIYTCTANKLRRSWKVIALQPPYWEGIMRNITASEEGDVHLPCGTPHGQPPPEVYWVLNAQLLKNGKGVRVTDTDLYISHVEKRHAGIVQCFACSALGCAYDAALLTVVPLQISDQDYSGEDTKIKEFSPQPPKRHNRKNSRKHKPILIPPSRPNITRLTDESVMVSWSKAPNHGLPIQFYKVQYKEVTNSSNMQWNTANHEIPPHIQSLAIDGLAPNKYYKFRVAAVYSNQDNKQGKSSAKFYLQGGTFQKPQAPELKHVLATSPTSLQLDWTWSSGPDNVSAAGFYVYYRRVSTVAEYEKVVARAAARSLTLDHLAPDTAYEVKMQAYTPQAPSGFSSILVGKTLRGAGGAGGAAGAAGGAGGAAGGEAGGAGRGDTLVTAGGAGAALLLLVLAAALLLCRRAKRPHAHKEKGSVPESGGANGYIPAKVPITITANPMHSESGDGGVEMAFLHNNNTGNNDDTLPHARKNGPAARQYL